MKPSTGSQIGELEPPGLESLALSQERFWLLQRILPNEPNLGGVALNLRGALDRAALQGALDALVGEQACLRATFHLHNGSGRVRLEPPEGAPLAQLDLADCDPELRARRLRSTLDEGSRRPFDLRRLPLLRATLIRLAPEHHVLQLVCPQLLGDWNSLLTVLPRRLLAHYEALATGGAAPPAPALDYGDFTRWQRELHTDEAVASMLAFWQGHLGGAPEAIELPVDRPRPPILATQGRQLERELEPALVAGVRELAVACGADVSDVLLAAWATLLMRYGAGEDLLVGVPLPNRALPGSQELFGCLMNPVVRRIDLSGAPGFRQLIERLRAEQRLADANWDLALDVLLSSLGGRRDPSRNPLYQVLFSYHEVPRQLAGAGLELEVERLDPRFTLLDLSLHADDAGEQGLRLRLEHSVALYDADTAGRALDHLTTLLEDAVRQPDRPLRRLRLLPEAERQRILVEWNDTSGPYPDQRLMQDLFQDQAARSPDAIALRFGDQTQTYGELEARANQLAHHLRGQGVGRGSLVGICVERSLEMIAGMFAVLKAGGAYVPLDPAYPPDRLAFMLEDTAAPLLLTQRPLLDRLPAARPNLVFLDEALPAGLPTTPPPCPAEPDDVAYIIYTSGSTGRPKGVVVRHRPALNLIDWVNGTYQVGPDDCLLFVTSINFDLSVYDVFGILGSGGSLRIASREELWEPERLVRYLDGGEITFWDSAPPQLVQCTSFFPARAEASRLRLVFLSGDWIPVPLPDQIRRTYPGAQVISLGGATEATIWSNVYPIGEVEPSWSSIPYGKPIRNARYHVLDAQLEPQPIGVPGELFIGGLCLADGYHARPELTAERFIPDPFSEDPAARLYRTGDLARYFADGNLEFLGRIDHQVKVRGYRIELGEIEAALTQHPGVDNAVVLAPHDETGSRSLVAYVVGPGAEAAPELRAFLLEKLPDYMVPVHYMRLDALPLSANGKVDRKALPAPARTSQRAFDPPQGQLEQQLASLWEELLGVERVGRLDEFFALGGHSLVATMVVSRVREQLAVKLPVRSLFQHSVLAHFAAQVEQKLGERGQAAGNIPAREGTGPVALARPQELFWYLDRLEPESTAYLLPMAASLRGRLDLAVLERALTWLVRRQEALRTNVQVVDGEPMLQVSPPPERVSCPLLDLSPSPDPRAELRQRLAWHASQPFDIQRDDLLRLELIRLDEDEHVLAFTMHHILSDGWSVGVFLWELSALYAELLTAEEPGLPELPIHYTDYAAWQREQLDEQREQDLLEHWRERLSDLPAPASLAPAYGGPRSYRSATLIHPLPLRLSQAVFALSRQRQATPFMTLLAAFQLVLARWTARRDLVLGFPVAGREHPELEDMIGCFVNSLVLRTRLEPSDAFEALLGRVREGVLEALGHADLPFHVLLARLFPDRRDASGNPLFRIFFNYLSPGRPRPEVPGLGVDLLYADDVRHKFELTLYVRETPEGLRFELVYDADLLDAGRVGELAAQLEHVLEQVTADPDRSLDDCTLVTPGVRALLPALDAPLDPEGGESLVTAFGRQLAAQPGRVAVVDGARSWTYAELGARVAGISAALRAAGVGPGSLVAVHAAREASLPAALLGVLHAGAAFCVLDPAYPDERLVATLDVARPRAWISLAGARSPEGRLAERVGLIPTRLALEAEPPTAAWSPGAEDPDALAYVAFTSGTTGVPKAIEGTQRPVAHFLEWETRSFELGREERWSLLAGLAHDPLLREIFGPLGSGAALHVPVDDVRRDPAALHSWLEERRISVAHMTPSLGRLLATAEGSLPDLRLACFGGEALLGRDVQRLRRIAPAARWVNLYGTTETPQGMGFHEVTLDGLADEAVAPLGRGIADVQLLVLDERGRSAGVGELGEVVVRTPYLARGYRGEDPGGRFQPTPGASAAWDRIYRTGDQGRYRLDGVVELVGRLDRQVQLRGYRVELDEVELVLRQQPGVAHAVVRVDGRERLQAYVTPAQVDPQALLAAARRSLPPYMVPASVTPLASLPMTPGGKLDLARLPDPAAAEADEVTRHEPRTQAELQVAELWEELLGVAVCLEDDFFALGGHSLLAVQMLSLLGQQLGARLPVGLLLEHPTAGAFAEALHREALTEEESLVVSIQEGGERPPLWIVHPVGGHVVFAHRLAEHLDDEQPLYGIQAQGLDGRRAPFDDLEAMAAHYVQLVRAWQPHGPYYLCGPSLGGKVVYEMARQLTAAGERVPLLAVFDTYAPGYPAHKRLSGRVADHLRSFKELSWGERADYVKRRVTWRVQGRAHGFKRYDLADEPERDTTEVVDTVRRVIQANHRASQGYAMRTWEGQVQVFRATQVPHWPGLDYGDETNGWRRYAEGGVEVFPVDGDHQHIMDEPAVSELGAKLQALLSRVQSREG